MLIGHAHNFPHRYGDISRTAQRAQQTVLRLSRVTRALSCDCALLSLFAWMSHRNYAASNPNVQRSVTFDNTLLTPSSSSRASSVARGLEPSPRTNIAAPVYQQHTEDTSDWDSDEDEMSDRRPPLHRPTDGRSGQPLLHKDDDDDRGRTGYSESGDLEATAHPPVFSRRSTMRSRSPDTQAKLATRKKYTYAAFFLGLSLISFVIQTETAVYIQHELHWNKAYCMLCVSSWLYVKQS